jgi:hypothetical protein
VRDFRVGIVLTVDGELRPVGAGVFVDATIRVSEDSILVSIADLVVCSTILGSVIGPLKS